MKLDVDGLLYHSIPLKYVTKGDTLNRMFSDPRKKRKCFDNLLNKYTKKKNYDNNNVHAIILPKHQKMFKIQVLRTILHEVVQKHI